LAETGIAPHRVIARNIAVASENKIHDDAVARRFGFAGGLVPGIEIYAYMTHLPVARWGLAWLERGSAECRLLTPVYDGEHATVTGKIEDGRLDIAVESKGGLCATGRAGLPDAAPVQPNTDNWPWSSPPTTRPAADEQTLAPGTQFGTAPFLLSAEFSARYLADVGETHSMYATEGLCHPGILLRLCNWALTQNVVLGPWIHAGSKVQNFAAARVGAELRTSATVRANYEHKGHRFVDLDVLVFADTQPIARVEHTAIWRPRQIAQTA
jgi:hypothetical protein